MKKYYMFWSIGLVYILSGCGGGSSDTISEEYQSLSGKVSSVLDGDTFDISKHSVTVRMACIDAPEINQAYGMESKNVLSRMINEYDVDIKYTKSDRYGRILGFVSNGRNVNLEMVRSGKAWVFRSDCSICEYYDAEVYARNNRLGLWGSNNPVPPWIWRKQGSSANNKDWTYLYHDRCPTNNSSDREGNTDNTSRCGSKKYCSQMNSCTEAMYYYEQCNLSRLDGDNDGIPCESLCR